MRPKETPSNPQCEFIQNLFEKKMRVDKRGWMESRQVDIEYDKDMGTAIAKLGSTRVMCIIEAEIGAPRKISRPGAGSIQFLIEFLPMANSAATESALEAETDECLTLLEMLYRDTSCIDFDTLCIEANQYVFDLKCILKVLEYDGGLCDCSTLAVTAALMGFKRNDVTYDAITKKIKIHHSNEKPMIPLTLIYKPATVTFGFVKDIAEPLVDPNENESLRIDGYITIGTNRRGEICLMYQSGKISLIPKTIIKCSEYTVSYVKKVIDKISNAVTGRNDDIIT